jgi:hypothetical protein
LQLASRGHVVASSRAGWQAAPTTSDKVDRVVFLYIFWSLCLLNIDWFRHGQTKGGNTKIVHGKGINPCKQLRPQGMDGQGPHWGNPANCTPCCKGEGSFILSCGWVVHAKVVSNEKLEFFVTFWYQSILGSAGVMSLLQRTCAIDV